MEKNQDQKGMDQNQSTQSGNSNQPGQAQPTGGQQQQDENPQEGSQWNNYRTRELGGNSSEGSRENSDSNR